MALLLYMHCFKFVIVSLYKYIWSFPIVVVQYTQAHFGEGTSNIGLGGLACNGSEERLVDCRHAQPVCTHAEDAGVRCGGKKEMQSYSEQYDDHVTECSMIIIVM